MQDHASTHFAPQAEGDLEMGQGNLDAGVVVTTESSVGVAQQSASSSTYASLFSAGGQPPAGGVLGGDHIPVDGGDWSQEDDSRLVQLVTDLGKRKWDEVAEHMPGKKPSQCKERFVGKLMSGKEEWGEEEDRILAAAQSRLGDRWQDIAKHLPNRSADDCKDRWVSTVQGKAEKLLLSLSAEDYAFLDAHIAGGIVEERAQHETAHHSGGGGRDAGAGASNVQTARKQSRDSLRPWTPEEDALLIKLVEELGQGKWTQITRSLPGRTVMQCRQRYLNKLDPKTKKTDWTEEEDVKIVAAQSRLGNRWPEIAKFLDGRSDFNTQRRWLSVLSGKAQRMLQTMTEADFAFLQNVVQQPKKERMAWTDEEDRLLIDLVAKYGHGKWTLVAKQLNTGRTGLQCRQRYLSKLDPTITNEKLPLTEDEDRKIVAAQSRLGNRWQEIAKYLEGRSWLAVHQRWFSALQPRADDILKALTPADFAFLERPVKESRAPAYGERHLWTKEDDAQLLALVNEIEQENPKKAQIPWTQIAKKMPGRLPKQCRQRYYNKVDPTLSNAPWTEEEDRKIVAAQSRLGNRFAEIARFFDGRSESVVSHRWHLVLQWRKEEILKELKPEDFMFLGECKEVVHKERKEWTHEEDMLLVKLVEDLGQSNWSAIATHFTDRPPKRCRDRYLNKLDPNISSSPWTAEEDNKIVAAQNRLGNRWQDMSRRIPGRSERAVKDRWASVLQHKAEEILAALTEADFEFLNGTPATPRGRKVSNIVDVEGSMDGGAGAGAGGLRVESPDEAADSYYKPWKSEEDALLLKLVEELGQGKWTQVAKSIPGRQAKQCRARYVDKLDPQLRADKFTDEEDRKIVAAHSRLGNKFADISRKIGGGRSEKQVSRRWNRVLAKKAGEILATMTKEEFAFLGDEPSQTVT